ncbi:hypothetical protein FKM82_008029 [Ascaphus truei]
MKFAPNVQHLSQADIDSFLLQPHTESFHSLDHPLLPLHDAARNRFLPFYCQPGLLPLRHQTPTPLCHCQRIPRHSQTTTPPPLQPDTYSSHLCCCKTDPDSTLPSQTPNLQHRSCDPTPLPPDTEPSPSQTSTPTPLPQTSTPPPLCCS